MIKSFILLCALTWLTFGYAQVAKENLVEAHGFKVAEPQKEGPKGRSVAGGKFKKKSKSDREPSPKDDHDSEAHSDQVRYWQYQE